MNSEYGNNDFDDPLRCPGCGNQMVMYMDTPICQTCDKDQVLDLTWQKNHIKENKKI
jgi:hypothetical protein